MKFIFPQNYNFKNKLFGMIDYSTAFVNVVWYAIVFIVLHSLISDWTVKIFVFIVLCFPLLLFSFAGFHGENIVYVLYYLFRYVRKQKLFFYK